MKTLILKNTLFPYSITLTLALCAGLVSNSVHAQKLDALDGQDAWQNNRLFAPTANQRQQEGRGKVVIYDGLKDTTIDSIMDKAFDRIQNMMFIRIIHTDKAGQPMHDGNGEVITDDDDC